MIIYFSGSISGGRDDVDLYGRIVEHLRRDHEVVAGEVVNPEIATDGEPVPDREIFRRDMTWIEEVARQRGILVAEVSTPSTGVGYEIAVARHRHGIPVVCLWRPGRSRRCTAMVSGDAGITLIRYEESGLERLLKDLDETLARLSPERATASE